MNYLSVIMGPSLVHSSIVGNPMLVQKVSLGGKRCLSTVGIILFVRVFYTIEAVAFL